MSRIIQPVVSPTGRVILLTGATLWLIASIILSATPEGVRAASADTTIVVTYGAPQIIEEIGDTYMFYPRVFSTNHGVFVTDRSKHRVIRLDETLQVESYLGRQGAGPGEMQTPWGVAVDSNGNVFVADAQLGRINKFAADGTFVRSVAARGAATLVVDAYDNLIVYPAPGPALLRRYSNDLEPGEDLFVETNDLLHRGAAGVLMQMDAAGNLYLVNQDTAEISVYDRDMQPLRQWTIDDPGLQESIARRLEAGEKRNPEGRVAVPAFSSMLLDERAGLIRFAYPLDEQLDGSLTRVLWYSLDGEFVTSLDRPNKVFSSALLADGSLIEGSSEALFFYQRGPQTNRVKRGN